MSTEKDSQREAFLKALQENDDDHATRLVFADWLDDHDEPEEADRMRAYKAAKEWLVAFADRTEIHYRKVIRAGHDAIKYDEHFIQYGDEIARDLMYSSETREAYWNNWSIVTGVRIAEEQKDHTVFSCSC